MNDKLIAIIGAFVLVAFMGTAFFAYGYLGDRVEMPEILSEPSAVPAQSAAEKDIMMETQGATVPVPGAEEANVSAETQTEAQAGTEERITAMDFTVLDAEGAEVKLSDLFGKPVVLNFWASWCPPCKSEMPEFNKVYEEMGEDVTFMMVDLADGQQETAEKGAAYVAEQGFTFPVYYDTQGEAGYTYGISSIPTTIFIDKDGYIVTGAQGAIDEATLRQGISFITAAE
jgi:thiol-disulfide isomerase/thioredoxin